jgi:hypothetical protein
MVHRFSNVVFFKIFIKFSKRYIANMIGAARHSWIPQANLHAALNFVHVKNYSYLKVLLVSTQ